MTRRANSSRHRPSAFAQARAQAEIDTKALRARAARTVAGRAVNDADRTRLLSMLGLDEPPHIDQPAGTETVSLLELECGLAGYVHAVATEVGVPAETTGFEVSDTITAYLGLPDRCAGCPNRDLMLVWNERDGWLVAAETRPTEPTYVIGYLGGHDILPHPHTVAQFVTTLLSGHHPSRSHLPHPPLTAQNLAELLGRYRMPPERPPIISHQINLLA